MLFFFKFWARKLKKETKSLQAQVKTEKNKRDEQAEKITAQYEKIIRLQQLCSVQKIEPENLKTCKDISPSKRRGGWVLLEHKREQVKIEVVCSWLNV